MSTEPTSTPKSNKTHLYAIGGILLLVLLAGAAFLAGRLMNSGPGGGNWFSLGPGNGGEKMVRIQLVSAEELPAVQPETRGLFKRRDGNSLFVSPQDGIRVVMENGQGGVVDQGTGSEIEVVVTRDTQVFRDATRPDFESESGTVQQIVEAGSLEDLTDQTYLTVWGRKTDDRIVADVIVYTIPEIRIKPPQ